MAIKTKSVIFIIMKEEWRDIKGYEGFYQVSNLGRVKSLERKVRSQYGFRTIPEIIRKPNKNLFGYLMLLLSKKGVNKPYTIHRLVAETFIPNPDNLPQINHKNEIKTDNRVENLEWCSSQYNNNYGTHNERMAATKINHPSLSKPIAQYNKNKTLVAKYPSAAEAERQTGINRTNIRLCCNGSKYRKTAGGYIWKFQN